VIEPSAAAVVSLLVGTKPGASAAVAGAAKSRLWNQEASKACPEEIVD